MFYLLDFQRPVLNRIIASTTLDALVVIMMVL
jgi:hypothetical protein